MVNWSEPSVRIGVVLGISVAFFCVEIAIGFRTRSLALISDAFHYLNDVVAYAMSLAAARLKVRKDRPQGFTFAFHRAELVGAFFNGVFLIALALSIFLQALERFIAVEPINDPLSVIIVGAVGLALNILSATVVHTHDHGAKASSENKIESGNRDNAHPDSSAITPNNDTTDLHALHNHVRLPPPGGVGQNLGLLGVLIHVLGDAANNLGVIVAGIIILELKSPKRFYADPAISLMISFMIFASAIPLTKKSGTILLEAAPPHLNLDKIAEDLKSLPDVVSIHDLHIWHLSQTDYIASFHAVIPTTLSIEQWAIIEANLKKCMSEYGITHVTIAPETSSDATMPSHDITCEDALTCGSNPGK